MAIIRNGVKILTDQLNNPKYPDVTDTEKDVNAFYDGGSVFVPNKYRVLLYGEYVPEALAYMKFKTGQAKSKERKTINAADFEFWKRNFVTDDWAIDLKWACESVTNVSKIDADTDTSAVTTLIKDLKYSTPKAVKSNTVTLNIVEDRGMCFYSFFEALFNQFYSPFVLKPRSAFHKLNMLILVNNQTLVGPKKYEARYKIISEYNSILMNGFPGLKLSQGDKNILKYGISFYCPNPFESPFNDNLAGMRELCTDGDILDKKGNYIFGNLEISEEARKKDVYHQSDWYSAFHGGLDTPSSTTSRASTPLKSIPPTTAATNTFKKQMKTAKAPASTGSYMADYLYGNTD